MTAESVQTPREALDTGSKDVEAARKYDVLMELGRGGSAVVSAGLARGMGGFSKLVVLKKIKEEVLGDRATVKMFVNEARLSARMNHPNIVQVYEVYRDNKLPVIVMEYLDGQSFATLQARAFDDPAFTVELAITVLCKVLSALQYAHTLTDYDGTPFRIVHRDVSPQNVMITYEGQVKLLDFGIAKLAQSSRDTKTGVVKGKVAYMAPEQLESKGLDSRADLFAVGVMLWEVVSRRRIWGERTDVEIIRSLVCDDIPSIRSAVPDVDPELERICARALANDPNDRYATAAAFQADLEKYLNTRGAFVHQTAIGELVSRVCADLRKASKEALERELVRVATPGWDDPMMAFDRLHTRAPEKRRWGGKLWALAALMLVLVGGFAAWHSFAKSEPAVAVGRREPAPPPAPAAPVAAPAVPVPQPPAAPENVTLKVEAIPRGANVWLDGREVGVAPFEGTLPSDGTTHELRVQAEGYEPFTQQVKLQADQVFSVALSKSVKAAPPKPAARPRRPAPAAPPASPPEASSAAPAPGGAAAPAPAPSASPPSGTRQPAVSCDPPYYTGEDGLKHYKRECL